MKSINYMKKAGHTCYCYSHVSYIVASEGRPAKWLCTSAKILKYNRQRNRIGNSE